MADDARISTALPFHPKTRKLQKRLTPSGCWSLVCLFLWTAGNRWTGDLNGLSDEDIELASQWAGEAGAFVKTLVEVAFLDGEPGKYKIHDWQEHNPWAATRGMRVEAAKKAAAIRWQTRPDAERIRVASEPDAERMRPLQKGNAHHPTQPNLNTTSSELKISSDKGIVESRRVTPSGEAARLSQLLKAEIHKNKADFKITPINLRNWSVVADRMMRIDGRSFDQIAEVIRWVQGDEFWMANILSMEKLREKFDQLEMKRLASENHRVTDSSRPSDAHFVHRNVLPPCPLSQCDGSGYTIDHQTRAHHECPCKSNGSAGPLEAVAAGTAG